MGTETAYDLAGWVLLRRTLNSSYHAVAQLLTELRYTRSRNYQAKTAHQIGLARQCSMLFVDLYHVGLVQKFSTSPLTIVVAELFTIHFFVEGFQKHFLRLVFD